MRRWGRSPRSTAQVVGLLVFGGLSALVAAAGIVLLGSFAVVVVAFVCAGRKLLLLEDRYSAWRLRRMTALELNTRRVKP